MNLVLRSVVLLYATCTVLCYRSTQHVPSGSYSLPSIGKYPSPTVFNPRNQGLPGAYKHYRMSRSVGDKVAPEPEEQALPVDEVLHLARSVNEFNEERHVYEGKLAELSRQIRSPGVRIIYPTYRPPPPRPPKIYTV